MTAVVERTLARPVVRQASRSTALVAVQHPAARETAVRLLRALGASDVVAAPTVADARRAAVPRNPDLCVVEATLPDGSGVGLAGDLRAAGWERIVVLSTDDDPFAVRAAVAAGVRCFVGAGSRSPAAPGPSGPSSLQGLSQREIEVLQLVADGRSNRDVGQALGLSALTVKSHLARIARKLGTGDRAEMVVIALRAGAIR